MDHPFTHLLQPIVIGSMPVRNRMVMAPMNTGYAGPSGEVTSRMIDYYERRARHGVGLMVVEATGVVGDVKNMACQPRLSDDAYIPGFATLAERIRAHEVKTLLQIQHSGNEAAFGELVSASEVGSKAVGGKPRPLTRIEITDMIAWFADTAERAYRAGFDGVEIHAAHGYLLNQFLSPFFNRRSDEYGGSVENRGRIVTDIIRRIRSSLGSRFVISVRYSAKEYIEGGLDVADSARLATLFQEAGADCLHVASAIYDSGLFISGPAGAPKGMFVPTARKIKQTVEIPVIVVGRINDPFFAESVLKTGSADMIAFGRAFLGDPEFPEKVYQNRPQDIRRCIGCRFCGSRVESNLDVRCAVNPATGRERYFPEGDRASTPRTVLVIGGGPAGMEAAITAHELGHRVTLVEREAELGGQLKLAVIPPFKEVHYLLDYQRHRIQSSPIETRLETEADNSLIADLDPDAVILATGARPRKPPFPVVDCDSVMSAWEALSKPDKVGKNVVIVGGGSVGCETAEFLAGQHVEVEWLGMKGQGPEIDYRVIKRQDPAIKRQITVIELLDEVAVDEEWGNRSLLLIRLRESGVRLITGVSTERIEGNRILFGHGAKGLTEEIAADTFIFATGVDPRQDLTAALAGSGRRLLMAGDCVIPGTIRDAVYGGALAVRRI